MSKRCAMPACRRPVTAASGMYELRYRNWERVRMVLTLCASCGAQLEAMGAHKKRNERPVGAA